MSEPTDSCFGVTAADILSRPWQEEIASCKRSELSSKLYTLGTACTASADKKGEAVYALLLAVCQFLPSFDSKGNPFGPWMNVSGTGTRSLMAEDLADYDLDALQGILPQVQNPAFRSRIGDVVWECRKKSHEAGSIAVDAYLECATADAGTVPVSLQTLADFERAAQLAAKMGFGKPLHQEVLKAITSRIATIAVAASMGNFCARLISILCAHKSADAAFHGPLAERFAAMFEQATEFGLAEEYWSVAADVYHHRKDEIEATRCALRAAECLVSIAEKGAQTAHLGACFGGGWMARALTALRRANADPDRLVAVHKRLLELQLQSLKGLGSLGDIASKVPGFLESQQQMQEQVIGHIRGNSLKDAIVRLAAFRTPTDFEAHRKETEGRLNENIWLRLPRTLSLDYTGKVADIIHDSPLESPSEEAIKKHMLTMAKMTNWPIAAAFWIEPARLTILEEHDLRLRGLAFLVIDNPFIPPGHEPLVLRGLHAGFYGDWPVAMHLLIPQIEAAVRYVIQQRGGITSTLESDDTQAEREINQILWMKEAEEAFGPDVMFDLRGILIEPFGHNMRNEMAHGLIPEPAFQNAGAVYLWWLVLMLCWNGHCLLLSHQGERGQCAKN